MAVVVEREWVRTWIAAMFDVALGILLIFIGIMLLFLNGSFQHIMSQMGMAPYPPQYWVFDLIRAISAIGYAAAIFVLIYGFKRIVDSILKAWTRTTVKTT